MDAVKKRVSGEMVKQDWTYGSLGINRDNNGNTIGNVNYKSFMAEYEAAKSRGDGIVKFTDQSGTQHEINFADADRQKGFLLKNNEDSYIREIVSGNNGHTDVELTSLIQDAQAKGGLTYMITPLIHIVLILEVVLLTLEILIQRHQKVLDKKFVMLNVQILKLRLMICMLVKNNIKWSVI